MYRFIASQLRFRRGRIAALGLGILVAAVSFTVFTSAAETSELRVKGTVSQNFRTAYDILVRPQDSFTPLERERGLVRANYLGGIYGGITHEQYRQIRNIPGVDVAAPIANIGYIMAFRANLVALNRHLSDAPAQMYRVRFTWRSHNNTSRYPDSDQYVYYTRLNRMRVPDRFSHPVEVVDGDDVEVCDGFWHSVPHTSSDPFSLRAEEGLMCFSERSPGLKHFRTPSRGLPRRWVGTYSIAYFPILIAAIDPVQEQRLVGLADTIVDGRMLRPHEESRLAKKGRDFFWRVMPVIASTKTYVDANVRSDIERLDVPEPAALRRVLASEHRAYDFVRNLEGEVVATDRSDSAELYEAWLDSIAAPKFNIPYTGYWTISSVGYRSTADDRLTPQVVRNRDSVFSREGDGGWAPLENRDVQFRSLHPHRETHAQIENERGDELANPAFTVVGRFDPERLAGFSELAAVPLETYYPPSLQAADDATAEVLDGQPLLPTQNLGDYIAQPPLILTTLDNLPLFTDGLRFKRETDAPISVIRVRVAGVTGPDAESRERIRRVAQTIHERTGLAIDVTAGSSPQTLRVDLPAGDFGRPPLALQEEWVTKGVAVAFLAAVDRKSVALFGLILLICVFFLANGVLASVRTRRAEMGILVCLGWSNRKIFAAIVSEVILIGAVAGIVGTLVAGVLIAVWSLEMSLARGLLVMPVALGLAGIAAVIPAWRAARSTPLDAVRPAISEDKRGVRTRNLVALALVNLRRVPSRTLLGASGLFISVCAFTLLLAINHAFQGVLVGTVMGQFISLQVRGVDLLTIALTILLGGLAVADVLYLNVRERAAEFVTLRTTGWRNRDLRTLVALEGIAMGAIGSLGGALLAVAACLLIQDIPLVSIAVAALVAAAAGTAAAAIAALLPLSQINRLTPPAVLAEEW